MLSCQLVFASNHVLKHVLMHIPASSHLLPNLSKILAPSSSLHSKLTENFNASPPNAFSTRNYPTKLNFLCDFVRGVVRPVPMRGVVKRLPELGDGESPRLAPRL